ncbi:MAG TPA: histidinol-phosphate aminotransferase, partial [Thermoanaerobaculia bacterium]
RDTNVARVIEERERLLAAMRAMPRVVAYPSRANFIAFESRASFDDFLARGILIRKYADFLRVSIGTPEQNDAFLAALQELA